jgi:hypothetical protein
MSTTMLFKRQLFALCLCTFPLFSVTNDARADELADGMCQGNWTLGSYSNGESHADCEHDGNWGRLLCPVLEHTSVCRYFVSNASVPAQVNARFTCCTGSSQTDCLPAAVSEMEWTAVNGGWENVRPCPESHPYAIRAECKVASACQ